MLLRLFLCPTLIHSQMVPKDTGEPIGCTGLVPEGAEHYPLMEAELEAGYWIGRPYWNQV